MSEIVSVLPPDSIPAITNPTMVRASQSDIPDDELVIGLHINGQLRAYPLSFLSRHEIINDRVGGRTVAVTYCPLCASAIIFDRRVNGNELTFRVSGMLYKNDLVMYDTKTRTLWSQILGAALQGPAAGSKLASIPSTVIRWGGWKENYPQTMVMERPQTGLDYSSELYEGYQSSRIVGISGQVDNDQRIHPKETVIGLHLQSKSRAYPFRFLADGKVVNDALDGVPIAIVYEAGDKVAKMFVRTAANQTLILRRLDARRLIDEQTGTVWSILDGRGVAGKLRDHQLNELPSLTAYWFAWKAFYPHSEVYGLAKI